MAIVQLGGNQSDFVVKLKFWHPVVQKCLSLLVSAIEGCKSQLYATTCVQVMCHNWDLRLKVWEGAKCWKKLYF